MPSGSRSTPQNREAMAHWQLRTARCRDRRKGPAPHRSKGKQGTSEGRTQNHQVSKVMRHHRLSTELGLHVRGAQKGEGGARERWSSSTGEVSSGKLEGRYVLSRKNISRCNSRYQCVTRNLCSAPHACHLMKTEVTERGI